MRVLLGGFQQIAFRADVTFQRHHHFFANGIDGRVGYLRKQLFEIIVDHARLVRQTGQRRIVTHGADRVTQFAHQRQQHKLHGLDGVTEGLHARDDGVGIEAVWLLLATKIG